MINKNCQHLSNREEECLYWISKGYTAKEIARELHISHRTVEEYVHSIRQKTNLMRRSQMVAYYNEHYGVKYLNIDNPLILNFLLKNLKVDA